MSTIKEFENIGEVQEYYGKQYRKIFEALETIGAKDFRIDTDCGHWLELWFSTDTNDYKINIGINNKYNVWKKSKIMYSFNNWEGAERFATQKDAVSYLYSVNRK